MSKKTNAGIDAIVRILRNAKHQIEFAKKYKHEDPTNANYALRDLQLTEMAGLKDLSWAMHRACSLCEADVDFLIEQLEQYIKDNF